MRMRKWTHERGAIDTLDKNTCTQSFKISHRFYDNKQLIWARWNRYICEKSRIYELLLLFLTKNTFCLIARFDNSPTIFCTTMKNFWGINLNWNKAVSRYRYVWLGITMSRKIIFTAQQQKGSNIILNKTHRKCNIELLFFSISFLQQLWFMLQFTDKIDVVGTTSDNIPSKEIY